MGLGRALAVAALAVVACKRAEPPPLPPMPTTIRCAVIGGFMETGAWHALSKKFEAETGNKIEVAAVGPKPVVVAAFRAGGIDLITVHASDAMVNLVADGLAVDPQPWARNDLVLVGPSDDPAQVRGDADAADAVKKIIAAKQKLLVHASNGADTVLHDLLEDVHAQLPDDVAVLFSGEDQHAVLARAAALHAYTIVGRIPFIDGKLSAPGMELMVRGDRRMRRPYLVETAPTAPPAAKQLAAWLRSAEVQSWLAEYGKGRYDAEPLFYPVVVR